MKTILDTVSDTQAREQLKKFTLLGLPFSVVGFFIFGWLGLVGTMFAARAFILSFHKGNKEFSRLWGYRLLALFILLLGLVDVGWIYFRSRS